MKKIILIPALLLILLLSLFSVASQNERSQATTDSPLLVLAVDGDGIKTAATATRIEGDFWNVEVQEGTEYLEVYYQAEGKFYLETTSGDYTSVIGPLDVETPAIIPVFEDMTFLWFMFNLPNLLLYPYNFLRTLG